MMHLTFWIVYFAKILIFLPYNIRLILGYCPSDKGAFVYDIMVQDLPGYHRSDAGEDESHVEYHILEDGDLREYDFARYVPPHVQTCGRMAHVAIRSGEKVRTVRSMQPGRFDRPDVIRPGPLVMHHIQTDDPSDVGTTFRETLEGRQGVPLNPVVRIKIEKRLTVRVLRPDVSGGGQPTVLLMDQCEPSVSSDKIVQDLRASVRRTVVYNDALPIPESLSLQRMYARSNILPYIVYGDYY